MEMNKGYRNRGITEPAIPLRIQLPLKVGLTYIYYSTRINIANTILLREIIVKVVQIT